MKYLVVILVIALGVAGIVYGGIDDSPGGQLLGVLLIVGAVAVGVRIARPQQVNTYRSTRVSPTIREGPDHAPLR